MLQRYYDVEIFISQYDRIYITIITIIMLSSLMYNLLFSLIAYVHTSIYCYENVYIATWLNILLQQNQIISCIIFISRYNQLAKFLCITIIMKFISQYSQLSYIMIIVASLLCSHNYDHADFGKQFQITYLYINFITAIPIFTVCG